MSRSRFLRIWPIRYSAAIIAAAAAFLLRRILTPLIGPTELGFTVALPAVLLAGWFGGLGPGALCVLLSGAASTYYFVEPVGSFLVHSPTDQITFLIYVVLGFGVVLLAASERRSIERAVMAESAQRVERERLETTLRSIGDAVVATDAEQRVTFANRVALSLLGSPEKEISGKPLDEVFRIVNEESRAAVESPVKRVFREGGIVGLANHTVLIAKDGTERPIDDSAAPIRDAAGEITGAVLVFRDVTGKRAAEKRMAEQSAELRQRAQLMEDAYCFVRDLEDHIVYWNPGATDLYGFAAAEAVGQVSHSLLKTVFSSALEEIRAQLFETGEWDGELVHTRRDGRKVTVASHWALHRNDRGEPVSILETNMDISERLELLAKERALATERTLRETEAELARVLRALSVNELASSIAHEVNQPLAGVVTNAEAGLRWLSGSAPDLEEAKASLALIARDAHRASAVIRRIREFLKKENPETVSIDANDVIRDSIALTRGELEKRRIELRTELAGDLPRVSGDRVQLQQVILNLVLNGMEAMEGTPEPKELVVMSRKSGDGGVLVAVRDSGAGISAQDMPRIFNAFFTTKPRGTGMGLSICRSILEAHGGRIWAEANEGVGITVQFALPAGEAEEKLAAASEAS